MPDIEIKGLARLVGRAIAKHRVACDLTQEQVAERLKIGVEAVSRIERGIVLPTVVRLIEFAEVFQCNVTDLMTQTSSRPKDQAQHVERLLSKLAQEDRIMILELVERLATRLE
tara:strand:- start:12121 stop:12462 length:342 start_codon:yes stop_codon:yes gene_type:complete